MLYLAIAASVSPPPAIENAPLAVASATPSASWCVPSANASNSNTPIGPFQMIVPAERTMWPSASALDGPMSRIISSGRTSSARRTVATAVAENSFATTTSIGSGSVAPLALSVASTFLHSGTRSGSASDLPMGKPSASRKVFAMPPPTINWSTFCARLFRIVSLVETFEPATIATSGRFGLPSARDSASISAAISGPAQATGAYFAMPCVVARDRGELARHLDVGAVLHERHRDEVGAALHRGVDVAHVLAGERRRGEPAALLVDALVV